MQINRIKNPFNFRAKAIVFALLFCLFTSQIMTIEQPQALIDELVSKGYTELRDLPVSATAEKGCDCTNLLFW
jgi:hypothetical protein